MIPNCAATRHVHFELDGSGPAHLTPPSLSDWPDVHWAPDYHKSLQVDLNTLTREQVASWKLGQTLLLSSKMLTGRDARSAGRRLGRVYVCQCRTRGWTYNYKKK